MNWDWRRPRRTTYSKDVCGSQGSLEILAKPYLVLVIKGQIMDRSKKEEKSPYVNAAAPASVVDEASEDE